MMTDEINYKPIILIDKPRGISSNHVLSQIKRIIRTHLKCSNKQLPKIGHGGTLDPEATGLLVVGLTRIGTRTLGTHIEADKIYDCEIDLLKKSVTGDLESYQEMDMPMNSVVPNQEIVQEHIQRFVGEIEQIPPIYSALKINGKKACDLARSGKEVILKSRKITIYSIDLMEYDFPVLRLRVHCSKGTYIRTLGQDIGKSLGLYGTLLSIHRIQSKIYRIEDSVKLDDLIFSDLVT